MGKKPLVVLGSLLGTGVLVVLVFSLGSWGFKHRETSLHAGRLQRLLELHPVADQVQAGLEAEGGRLLGQASSGQELRAVAERWAGGSLAAVLKAGERSPRVRVFLVGEFMYFIFFDGEGRMSDFVLVPPE